MDYETDSRESEGMKPSGKLSRVGKGMGNLWPKLINGKADQKSDVPPEMPKMKLPGVRGVDQECVESYEPRRMERDGYFAPKGRVGPTFRLPGPLIRPCPNRRPPLGSHKVTH